jgi:hypothetical protein
MKSNSNTRPATLLNLGNGKWHYNYNVVEGTRTDPDGGASPSFDYDTAVIDGMPDYGKIVTAIISERYSKDDELALTNKGIEDNTNADYVAYREWVNDVKKTVKNDLKNVENV